MKLYGHPLSSCTRKVLMTLAEKGVAATLVPVDLFAGEHKTPAYLLRHPFGVVPVLDDDGFVLYESRAIIRYLDARCPSPTLTPAAPREMARMAQWLSVDQSYVAPHTRALAFERVVKKHEGRAPDPAVERDAEAALASAFAVYDAALRATAYLVGDALSLADVSLAPHVASLPMIGAGHLLAPVPHLCTWWERIRSRPSWASIEAGERAA
jgi:glutathione S-transferase